MREWFTPAEIAELQLPGLPKTKRGINKVADTGGWKVATGRRGEPLARRRAGQGGALEYHYVLFPTNAQIALAARQLKVRDVEGTAVSASPQIEGMTDRDLVRRDARLAVILAADAYARAAGLKPYVSDKPFAALYNAGRAECEPWVHAAVKSVSATTLKRWRQAVKTDGPQALAEERRGAKNALLATAEDGEIATYIGALVTYQPHLNIGHIRDLVADKFGDEVKVGEKTATLPDERTFRRFVARWKQDHAHQLLKLTDPDRWKSTARLSGGNMNAHVERLNQLWEIDASPADVLTTDGRYNLYVVIDIWSRRMLALVTKTPRTEAALLLLRKAIIEWGVPEVLRTDNGSDFVSHQFKRALNSLGIEQDITAPFSPEQKGTVERAIGTLQRGLMPLLPGFVGHNVADRKQIEARKAFAARLGESDEKAFCVDVTSEELQGHVDVWLSTKYAHRKHGGLNNVTPFEKAASWRAPLKRIENVRALDLLLAPVAGSNGMRKITKRGIRLDNTYFIAAELLAGKSVFVRSDPDDMGRIYCFESEAGRFICEAVAPERLGVNPADVVAEVKRRQAKLTKEASAELRRAKAGIKARDLIDGVLRRGHEQNANLVAFPQGTQDHTTPSLEEAAAARDEARKPQLSDEQAEAHARLVAEHEGGTPGNVVQLKETPAQRFARALDLEQRIEAGEDVDPKEAMWLGSYQQGPEYRSHSIIFKEFGTTWLEALK